ncbi:MAG: hypothetical protein IPJ01_11770 [Micavibrio sp.]|nr:hypothetical protein [Micavibrio sp.]
MADINKKNINITQLSKNDLLYLKNNEVGSVYIKISGDVAHHNWQPIIYKKLIIINIKSLKQILIGSDGTIEKS